MTEPLPTTHLLTPWSDKIDKQCPWPEYPRPQMVRGNWQNLNGAWNYAILPTEASAPEQFDGEILVPYPVESVLSGVQKSVGPENKVWYQRSFTVASLTHGNRLWLHFGAVDWHTQVWINGQMVGEHKGGYLPFQFDITDALVEGEQTITVAVWDPTDTKSYPRGKQVLHPEGIWYTPVTGIWQTVWLEVAAANGISSVKVEGDLETESAVITVNSYAGSQKLRVVVQAVLDGMVVGTASGWPNEPMQMTLDAVRPWSPENPALYDLQVKLMQDEKLIDEVQSYFALRTVERRRDANGVLRMYLNGNPCFMIGPLDQGWWPDGLYIPATDEALRFDVAATLELGYNMARKHIKVEPERWYYWCDKLGLMVWQDMPSGFVVGQAIPPGAAEDAVLDEAANAHFLVELDGMIEALRAHPSIVVWVPFNEGWGQHDTNTILERVKNADTTRLVDGPTGWEDRGYGDMIDMHNYPGPGMFEVMESRISVLGEFGGLAYAVPGHLWWDHNFGYRSFGTREELVRQYIRLMKRLCWLKSQGLSAAVYTQTTDVEGEINGLLTYDRAIWKLLPEEIAVWHQRVIECDDTFKRCSMEIKWDSSTGLVELDPDAFFYPHLECEGAGKVMLNGQVFAELSEGKHSIGFSIDQHNMLVNGANTWQLEGELRGVQLVDICPEAE